MGYACLFAVDWADAEDLVQEALVRTFARRRSLPDARAAEASGRRAAKAGMGQPGAPVPGRSAPVGRRRGESAGGLLYGYNPAYDGPYWDHAFVAVDPFTGSVVELLDAHADYDRISAVVTHGDS